MLSRLQPLAFLATSLTACVVQTEQLEPLAAEIDDTRFMRTDQDTGTVGSVSIDGVLAVAGAGASYVGGTLGVGTTEPEAQLHVRGGPLVVEGADGEEAELALSSSVETRVVGSATGVAWQLGAYGQGSPHAPFGLDLTGWTELGQLVGTGLLLRAADAPVVLGAGEAALAALLPDGRLGVGTLAPGYPLEVATSGTDAAVAASRTDGAVAYLSAGATSGNVGTASAHPLRLLVDGTWRMTLAADGSLAMSNGATCTPGGVWTDVSTRASKANIAPLGAAEAERAVADLVPVTFHYRLDPQERQVGFVSEDVPALVATRDRKGLSAMDIAAVLTRVVQEQQRTIDRLERRVASLERQGR